MNTYKPRYPQQSEIEKRMFDPSKDKVSPDVPEPASEEPKKAPPPPPPPAKKKAMGGSVKTYAKGGVTRADGCAQRGKTRGRMV